MDLKTNQEGFNTESHSLLQSPNKNHSLVKSIEAVDEPSLTQENIKSYINSNAVAGNHMRNRAK